MEHSGVDSCRHQVICCRDGVNVAGKMEVELKTFYSKTDSGKKTKRMNTWSLLCY